MAYKKHVIIFYMEILNNLFMRTEYMLNALVPAALLIVGKHKTFEKAGVEGWKSLIPIYSYLTLGRIANVSTLIPVLGIIFGSLVLLMPTLIFLSLANDSLSILMKSLFPSLFEMLLVSGFLGMITIVLSGLLIFGIPAIICNYIIYKSLAGRFGKSKSFALGLVFVPFINFLILGFDNSRYSKDGIYISSELNVPRNTSTFV